VDLEQLEQRLEEIVRRLDKQEQRLIEIDREYDRQIEWLKQKIEALRTALATFAR
jgi:low affinity Fe/Cu permease